MPYDIAIIGAGPAGATLARLLPKYYRILLLDRRDLIDGENEKSKCCGGLLAPDAQQMLGKMGLAVPTKVLVDPQIFLVRTIDFDNYLERYYQRFYFNLDRQRFDEWLLSSVPDNVDLALGCRFNSLSETREGYEIAFMYKNRIFTEKVKLLVGADGAWSGVRRQIFDEKDTLKKYIAIQEWLETDKTIPYYGAVFDSNVTDFYSWTISKDQKLIIGSALAPDKDAKAKFELLKSNLREYGFEFGNCIKREGSYLVRPRKKDIITGNDHAALIGEAGGFISPSSAEGISFALKSAYQLAMSLASGIEGFQKRYRKNIAPLIKTISAKRYKIPAMYNRIFRAAVMKSGVLSSKTLFEDD
jgi:geranylgeranyl reductase